MENKGLNLNFLKKIYSNIFKEERSALIKNEHIRRRLIIGLRDFIIIKRLPCITPLYRDYDA